MKIAHIGGAVAIALTAPSAWAGDRSASADLSEQLGQVLHHLDQEQSRRLTRAGGAGTPGEFQATSLAGVADAIRTRSDRVAVVLGRRKLGGADSVEITRALMIPAPGAQVATHAIGKSSSRIAYAAPASGNSAALALQFSISTDHSLAIQDSTPERALAALAAPGSLGFVFMLDKSAVRSLVVVPDTIMINVSGGAPADVPDLGRPSTASDPRRVQPIAPPSAESYSQMSPPPEWPPQQPPTMRPPELTRPTPPPFIPPPDTDE